jgi:hypothetical protein
MIRVQAPNDSVTHTTERLTIAVGSPAREFIARYEQAVPPVPTVKIGELVAKGAPWSQMLELIESSATFGFLIYHKNDIGPVMQLAGNKSDAVAYLMGNHTIAERMYRYDPRAMLHAPLRTVVWETAEGAGFLTIDRPSSQFSSYENPAISHVGVELDQKLAVLLRHLECEVPRSLHAA